MKTILKILTVWLLILFSFSGTSASIISTWDNAKTNINCDGDANCDLQGWVKLVKDSIEDIEKERKFSDYIQDIVQYILGFISLVAVIYIIYAGFMILIWAWDEEKLKKSKQTILYVIIWIVLIWLAYSIVAFVMDMLNASA